MKYSTWQLISLIVLRLFVGWHFLYEGVIKLFNPYWTARHYLLSSESSLQLLFNWLASDSVIGIVNFLTIWLSIAAGAALLLGTLTRLAATIAAVLLLLFYLAHPALHGMSASTMGGNFWLVNYNLIEIAALLVIILFPTSKYFGLDNLIKKGKDND